MATERFIRYVSNEIGNFETKNELRAKIENFVSINSHRLTIKGRNLENDLVWLVTSIYGLEGQKFTIKELYNRIWDREMNMPRKKPKILTGIEIESFINEKKLGINVSSYHASDVEHDENESWFGNYWKCERDGSLHQNETDFGGGEKPVEFISTLLKGKEQFFKAVEDFKRHIKNRTVYLYDEKTKKVKTEKRDYPLRDVIDFNSSCGCHIHTGLTQLKKYYSKVDYEIIKQMREMFFKELDNSSVLSNDTKKKVKNHYYRDYSKKTTRQKYLNLGSDRYQEINTETELHERGLEWRSFNLYGVKDWNEFDEMFRIAWKCIEFLYDKRINGYELKKKALRISRKGWKDYYERQQKGLNEELNLGYNDQLKEVDNVKKSYVENINNEKLLNYDLTDEIQKVININEV